MIDEREMWALFSLLDDAQPSVQHAVRDRLLAIGDEAVPALRALSRAHHDLHAERVEDVVNELRMTLTLKRLDAMSSDPSDAVDLEEGVFAIARYGYPDMVPDVYRKRLDTFADDIIVMAGAHATPIDRFMKMRTYLFSDLGFVGNQKDYYNPDNSYINRVIDLRRGIPITLSVLLILVGRRLDIALHGIGMPMHFLVQYDDGSRIFFVDPFNAGMIITQDQCRALLTSNGVQFTPGMLSPVAPREMIERMWRNLLLAYQKAGDTQETARIAQILKSINPEFPIGSTPTDEDDDDDEEDEDF